MENISFMNILKNIIHTLEKPRFNILQIFLIIFSISLIRTEFENLFFNISSTIHGYAHAVAFYFCVFAGGILILRALTKENIIKIANIATFGFSFIIVPPIIDGLILQKNFCYDYLWHYFMQTEAGIVYQPFLYKDFPEFLFSFINYTGIGLLGVLCFFFIATIIYIFIKTNSVRKLLLGCIIVSMFMILMGLNPLLFLFHNHQNQFLYSTVVLVFFLIYFFLTIFFIVILIKILKKDLLTFFIKSLRPVPVLFLITMVIVGILAFENLSINLYNFGLIIISILIVIFVWCYTVIINHIYDVEIDKISNPNRLLIKGMLTGSQAKRIATIFAIISVMLAFLLGFPLFPLGTGLALFFGYLYSAPPIRLRNKVFSTTIIGLGSSLAFLIGYVTSSTFNQGYFFPVWTSIINISSEVIFTGVIIFIVFTFGSMIKDLKDVEGDKVGNV
jgi:4-hydroxybenzoate polyprenyltransferase